MVLMTNNTNGTVYKVELYNHWYKGSRFPGNGWYVARYVNGCRHQTVSDYGRDEGGARMYAAHLNATAV